jgi:hypothetical protein
MKANIRARAATAAANLNRVKKFRRWVIHGKNLEQRPDFPFASYTLTSAFFVRALAEHGLAFQELKDVCTFAGADPAFIRRRLQLGVTKNGWMWDVIITPTHLKLRKLKPFSDIA